MISRLLSAALLAGVLAGFVVSALQFVHAVPLILQAEAHEHTNERAAGRDLDGRPQAWEPHQDAPRTAMTVLSNVLTGTGFALVLGALFLLRGRPVGWRHGLLWGMAGFATFTVAPSLGLPPELPAMEAGTLADRQVWWIGTVVATGLGLAGLFLGRNGMLKAAGVALIALPHLIGAPHPDIAAAGPVPAELSARFVMASLATTGIFWMVLGAAEGALFDRFLGRARTT